MHNDPYHKIAEFYDLEHDRFRDDLEMYQSFVEAAGDPVLDVGCGTGRVSQAVAQLGFRVTGIDSSNPMLERARLRPPTSPAPRFEYVSMSDAAKAPGGPFGVAIIALDTFTHLPTQAGQIEALQSIHAALDQRGQLLIDVFNPQPDIIAGFDGSVFHEQTWTLDSGAVVQKFSARRSNASSQTIESFVWYDMIGHDARVMRFPSQFVQRYVMSGELLIMLATAGFEDFVLYGNYDLAPFEEGSPRLIVAAEMTKTS